MADSYSPTEEVLHWVDAHTLAKGRPYAESDAVFETRRAGDTLRARCWGSADNPYRVEVHLGLEGVVEADCSCPVGDGGYCKHVAALLLVWVEEPERFAEVPDPEIFLAEKSREELIAIIRLMLRQEPDLESLLSVPVPAAGKPKPADLAYFQRQAEAAFGSRGEWVPGHESARKVGALRETALEFLRAGDPVSAAEALRAIVEVVVRRYADFPDDEGDLALEVDALLAGLECCLCQGPADPDFRLPILRSVLDALVLDIRMGGICLADEAPRILVECTDAAERRQIEEWVRSKQGRFRDWGEEVLGGLLLDLRLDELSDEEYLQICRESGRDEDLVDRLLELGREDEALAHARTLTDYELLNLAALFEESPALPRFEEVVAERVDTSRDTRLIDWLRERRQARGDLASALELARKAYPLWPSLERYREIRSLAQEQGCWPEVRPSLEAELPGPGHQDLRIRIHLLEGELDEALAAVTPTGSFFPIRSAPEVAEALAAVGRLREAAGLWTAMAEHFISLRGRHNYREAARYLQKARLLFLRADASARWEQYREGLLQRNRNLWAMKEELERAGL